jgi:hypothetical protein
MKNQSLCQYKHVSVWSKDYDSAGGKKIFCIYMYYTQKKNFNSTNVGPKPGWKRRRVMHFVRY